MSLTVSYYCWLTLTVSLSTMELLHVSYCLPWLPGFYHSLSGPMELLYVSNCLICLLAVSYCLSECYGFATCFSLSFIVAGCLSLSLPEPCSGCISLTLS